MRDLRRTVAAVVIGSFSVAALLGIAALLGGGAFGEAESRVLLTTVIVGFESLAVLCYLALAGHRLVGVGVLGGLISLVCAGTALWWVWVSWDSLDDEPWRLFFSTLVLALTFAQASLLIRAADRDGLRAGMTATLVLAAVVAAMLIGPIVSESFPESDGYWRLFGVVAILDVLGTIVLMAMAGLGRRTAPSLPVPRLLGAEVARRVAREAAERGTTPDALVSDALDALRGRSQD